MTIISKPNQSIQNYLDFYRSNENHEYGVFINGKWGSGKTWFIKQYIDTTHELTPQKKKWLTLV